jgi:hypothetical protein
LDLFGLSGRGRRDGDFKRRRRLALLSKTKEKADHAAGGFDLWKIILL